MWHSVQSSCKSLTHAFIISACSSIRLPSPITIGPASAIIRALGWTTVLGPVKSMVKRNYWLRLSFPQEGRRWPRGEGQGCWEERFLKYVPGTTQSTSQILSPQLLSLVVNAKSQTKVSGDRQHRLRSQTALAHPLFWSLCYLSSEMEMVIIPVLQGCCKDQMR